MKVGADMSNFNRGMGGMERRMHSVGGVAKSAFGLIAKAGAVAGGAVAVGLGAAVKSSVQFERGMRNVNSIAYLNEKQFKALGKSVTAMAGEVGQKPKVLAEGLYDIVSSGFKASDAITILRVSAKAATAGMTDTATASKAVTAGLNAYHLGASEAGKVSDILFQVVNKGVLTFGELAQNMGDLVPAAAPLGVKLEEVGAALSTITLQGVPAAEAATRVKSVMLQLAKPSEELSGLLKENGFASGEAAIKAKGFVGVLEMLDAATHGNVTASAALTPEIRGLLGVVGLTGKNLATYNEHLASMKEASKGAGASAKAFAEQSKSVGVEWQKVSALFDVG
ncbi:MAG: phage tail tape measure protein, partial [Gemmatimonadaceae bacterium]|nr:phage tail tape measure protein [Gemmatimonadaceae bacterium]